METSGKIAGRTTLARALPAPPSVEPETNSGTNSDTNSDDDPAKTSDSQSTPDDINAY